MRRFSAFITVSVMLISTALAEPGAFGQRNAQRVGFQTEAASPPGATIEPEAIVAPKTKLAPKAKPKPKTAAPVQHERVVMRNDPRPSIFPGAAEMIVDAAKRYRSIADQGDWPLLTSAFTPKIGMKSESVERLRLRLALEGDLDAADAEGNTVDANVIKALKQFQMRHGQSQTGIISGPTLRAMQVSANARADALEASAARLNARSLAFGARYVAVNIPSASVEAVTGGFVERRHIAIVGKPDRASPEVTTRITSVNLNPTWTVPVSIIKKDIIPKMQKDPTYLAKSKIRIFGASGAEIEPSRIDWKTERAAAFTLRQDSGGANALGLLKIDMPNRDAVYMHDTPSKRLFLRDDRFNSSGCVRVDNVRDLAIWLLDGTGQWERPTLDAAISEGARKDIRLKEPVPVIWAYLTGYVTPDGMVHFRPDVYGLDSSSRGNVTPVASLPSAPSLAPSPHSQPVPAPRGTSFRQGVVQRLDP